VNLYLPVLQQPSLIKLGLPWISSQVLKTLNVLNTIQRNEHPTYLPTKFLWKFPFWKFNAFFVLHSYTWVYFGNLKNINIFNMNPNIFYLEDALWSILFSTTLRLKFPEQSLVKYVQNWQIICLVLSYLFRHTYLQSLHFEGWS
jgi:hypothetical protein